MDQITFQQRIPKRILSSLVSSLSAGVVPRSGAPYIAIGRNEEIGAFLSDLENISEGGAGMRFLVGRYGSGKSFLVQLIRGYALERGFLTADCDLSPERRLYGTSGTGLATYRELIRNLASKSSPDGGALEGVLSGWLFGIRSDVADSGIAEGTSRFYEEVRKSVRKVMKELEFLVGGFDFASVISEYFRASETDDYEKASACLRWLRGEYSTKTEARRALGIDVSTVISDDNWYDFIKLWASLGAKTGYRGLVVFIDECVNLYKIPNRISRENNYEKILSMFNDTLQGKASHLGIVMCGTPQFLEDPRRGLFSYEALRSRLGDGRFADGEYKNLLGPVIRLKRLSDDELLALIVRITSLHALYYSWNPDISGDEQIDFLKRSLGRTGAGAMITPREMLRDYMTLLNILYQNREKSYKDIVGDVVAQSPSGSADPDAGAGSTTADGDGARPSGFDPEDIDF